MVDEVFAKIITDVISTVFVVVAIVPSCSVLCRPVCWTSLHPFYNGFTIGSMIIW